MTRHFLGHSTLRKWSKYLAWVVLSWASDTQLSSPWRPHTLRLNTHTERTRSLPSHAFWLLNKLGDQWSAQQVSQATKGGLALRPLPFLTPHPPCCQHVSFPPQEDCFNAARHHSCPDHPINLVRDSWPLPQTSIIVQAMPLLEIIDGSLEMSEKLSQLPHILRQSPMLIWPLCAFPGPFSLLPSPLSWWITSAAVLWCPHCVFHVFETPVSIHQHPVGSHHLQW